MRCSGNVRIFGATAILNVKHRRDLATLLETEMAPVAAILGGVLAQEMIKVLSKKELPIQNWFYYEGLNGKRP